MSNVKKSKKDSKIIVAVMGILFFAIGTGVSIWGISVLQNARESMSWPKVQGKITESKVDRNRHTSKHGKRRKTTYNADISYEYNIESIRYFCSTVSFGQYGTNNLGHAGRIVARYPKGKVVDIFYNPKSPDVAVLEPGATWSSYAPLAFGILFVLVALFVLANKFLFRMVEPT